MSRVETCIGIVSVAACLFLSLVFIPNRQLKPEPEAAVALPLPIELVLHAGDTHLLSNLTSFRTLVFPVDLTQGDLTMRALFHRRVSQLNPKHEDNYFIVNAALPWEGEITSAQYVLERAKAARFWDSMPAFMLGLNELYFNADLDLAAEHIRYAGEVEQGANKQYIQSLATFLETNTDNKRLGIAYLDLIAGYVPSPVAKARLKARKKRFMHQIELEGLVEKFSSENSRLPVHLEELIEHNYLQVIPRDPFGGRYFLGATGKVLVSKEHR